MGINARDGLTRKYKSSIGNTNVKNSNVPVIFGVSGKYSKNKTSGSNKIAGSFEGRRYHDAHRRLYFFCSV